MTAAGYGAAVDMLRTASRGTYRGPAIPVPKLIDALRTTEGLNPDDLVTHTRAAAGPAAGAWLGPLIQGLLTLLAEIALAELLRRLVDRAQDWWDNRDAARKLEDSAEDAGNALKDIEDVADTALTEITDALTAVITHLCAFLSRIDPATHPGMFQECVGAGSDLIDSAGDALLQTCADRDEAVAGCLDEFLARCEAVCEQPVAAPQKDVAHCETPPTAPVPAPESPVPPVAPGVPVSPVAPVAPGDAVTAPQSSGAPTPAPAPPSSTNEPTPAVPAAQEQPTTPQATAPVVPGAPADDHPPTATTAPVSETAPDGDAPEDLPTSPQTVTPEPVDEDTPAAGNCADVLGAAGLGVAALGLALLISLLEECLPELAEADMVPDIVPEPAGTAEPPMETAEASEIQPEVEPALAEVPEPTPPPKQNAPEPPEPPADLDDVPEPPPPPKQQIPTPPAADMPAPAPDNTSTPAPVPGGARKAGEW